jgi:5-methylcytosine-specific restriction endonuclease McrA
MIATKVAIMRRCLLKDVSGLRFGRLIALRPIRDNKSTKWLCKCDCGQEKPILTYSLTSGRTQSCGCLQKEITKQKLTGLFVNNLVGQRFGKLLVISEVTERLRGGVQWQCQCDCGGSIIVKGSELVRGRGKDCGCSKREQAERTWLNKIYRQYQTGASERGLPFCLTKDTFLWMIGQKCHYCGSKTTNLASTRNFSKTYNGIDRVESSKGYELNNCVTCCVWCNRAKGNRTLQDFFNWAESLFRQMKDIKRIQEITDNAKKVQCDS